MGYRVSFCLISNKPKMMLRWAEHAHLGMVDGNEYELCLSHEKFKDAVICEIDDTLPKECQFSHHSRKPVFGKDGFDFTHARSLSFKMAREPDFIVITDDDLVMKQGKEYSTGERYADSFKYMIANPDCGVVYHKGFLGGSPFGRRILPMDGGYMDTSVGMVLRGKRDYPLIADHYMVPGTGQDWSMGATALENGYYPAKAFNTPGTYNRATKSVNFREPGTIRHDGVFGIISKRWGDYGMGKPIPRRLKEEYRIQAWKKGFQAEL